MQYHQFNSLVGLACYELRRTRGGWLVLAVVITAYGVAAFAAGLAVTESAEHRIVLYAASARILAAFVCGLLAITNVMRDTDDQVLALILSRPVSRPLWLTAKATAYLLAAWIVALVLALPLLLMGVDLKAVGSCALALACELSIVTVAAIVAASSLAHVTLAFGAVTGFYVLSRAIEGLVLLSRDSMIDFHTVPNQWIAWGVDALSYVIPDFARFTPSAWLVAGGAGDDLGFILVQTAIFVPLLLSIGMIDFQRRNF